MLRAKRIWFHQPWFRGGLALGVLAALVLIGAAVALSSPARAAYPSQPGGAAAPARPDSASLVISQVYGGGGNSGALYTHDFIELFNPTTAAVAITNWSVQYASATGSTWQVSTLTGTITLQPGQYYLIQEAQGAGGSQPLPTPDNIGALAMSGTAGKVALVNNNTALACGTNCHAAAGVVDFVGYGTTANDFEGSGPAPAPANPSSDLRANGGCTDTDNNATDFAVSNPPTPRNRASTFNACGAQPTATRTVTPGGPTNTPTITRTPPPPGPRIHTIQGASHLAPYNGQSVANVQGVVTALRSNGFYMQDPLPDADDATSEAIFVFTSSAPAVSPGQLVAVSGQVTEFRAGGSGGLTNLTQT
jgi:predicted extracellular nuclease